MPRNTAGLPELVAVAGYDYYEIAPCLETCPADYQSQFTYIPNARPKHASGFIANFVANDPSNAVNECFAACSATFSCLSFTVVTDVYSGGYGRCQLYAKRNHNPRFQIAVDNKDLYYIADACVPTCPATFMDRFTLVENKRPINANGFFAEYMFGGGTAAEGAEACADRCRFHGSFACKAFGFMDRVEAGSFGQCRLYPKLYSASFLSPKPTPKDYYAFEGSRCVDPSPPTPPPPPPTHAVYVPPPPPPTPPPTNLVYDLTDLDAPLLNPPPTGYFQIAGSTCADAGFADVASLIECETAAAAMPPPPIMPTR